MAIENSTFRAYTEKLGATEASNFIGNEGDLFYDPNTSTLRVSNGVTPGGIPVSGGGGGGGISLTDLSVSSTAPGTAALSYDNITGVFSYTPPDLTSYAQTSSLNISNWDTAYSWGNHADAGYLTSVALNDVTDVTLTSPSNGQVLKYDGAGWVNGDESGGGTGGEADFVATGTIPNGAKVIIRTDGTVEAISASSGSTIVAGTPVQFAARAEFVASTYDSTNGKVVIAYQDTGNSSYGTAVVGTVSGSTISFGTPVVFKSGITDQTATVYDPSNDKIVIAYRDRAAGDKGTAIVGTVSGTSITFGSAVEFDADNTAFHSLAYIPNGKVVLAYKDAGNSSSGTAIIGTVSGNSISFGSPTVFQTGRTDFISTVYDSSNDKVVIAYRDFATNKRGQAIVGTVSGTSISFGTAVTFQNSTSDFISAVYDPTNNKVVVAYEDTDNASPGAAVVGDVSGTSITFGTKVLFSNSVSSNFTTAFDTSNNQVFILYTDEGDSNKGKAVSGTVSGTSISFGNAVEVVSTQTTYLTATFNSNNNKVVLSYQAGTGNPGRTAVIGLQGVSNLTDDNFIGIAAEAISDGATGKINIVGGINASQIGLLVGRRHYVQNDGTLGITPDNPVVIAGTAISATEIIVKG